MKLYKTILSSVILFATQASAQSQTNNIAWGVNSQHQVWHLNASGWNQVSTPAGSTFTQVSAGADGTVWGVDANKNVFSYTGSG